MERNAERDVADVDPRPRCGRSRSGSRGGLRVRRVRRERRAADRGAGLLLDPGAAPGLCSNRIKCARRTIKLCFYIMRAPLNGVFI